MTKSTAAILRLAAFTLDGTGGNGAGVVLDAADLSPADRLAIASDLGYSESAFLERTADGLRIQYFSPLAEVGFCGHATIATAVALAGRDGVGNFVFRSAVGPIAVGTSIGDDGAISATLTSVPSSTRPATDQELSDLLTALRFQPADLDPRYPPHIAFAGMHHPIIALRDRGRLALLDYDFDALGDLMAREGWITVDVLWAESRTVFHARNPFPPGGVVEDPATGAAAAAFGGYLRTLGLVEVPGAVTVLQGEDMGRPSRLTIELRDDEPGVLVSGTATPIQ